MSDAIADLVRFITDRGGVVRAAEVRTRRDSLAKAVAAGAVIRSARGMYTVPDADPALAAAVRLGGARSHLSAAVAHGWKIARAPDVPQVIVDRRSSTPKVSGLEMRQRPLLASERRRHLTHPVLTVLDCARVLPFADALAVADSALRAHPDFEPMLKQQAARLRGPGSHRARRVVRHATHLAANPFESVLRAFALEAGLDARAQVEIRGFGFWARVDVADDALRVALEADSFEWHGDRRALHRDAHRYSMLTSLGWRVLRFSWEAVFLRPAETQWIIAQAAAPKSKSRAMALAAVPNPWSAST